MEKTKFLTLPELELLALSRPARSQSLYRLRCPDSSQETVLFITAAVRISNPRQEGVEGPTEC
jgi:hypothetical protein